MTVIYIENNNLTPALLFIYKCNLAQKAGSLFINFGAKIRPHSFFQKVYNVYIFLLFCKKELFLKKQSKQSKLNVFFPYFFKTTQNSPNLGPLALVLYVLIRTLDGQEV